jgi:LysM repeat protein
LPAAQLKETTAASANTNAMNTPNPLVPRGSFLEQHKSRGKSNLIIAVFTILAIHVVLFTGLLMQGCKRENPTQANNIEPLETNLPPLDTNLPTPVVSNQTPIVPPTSTNLPAVPPAVPPAPVAETAPPPAPQEYTVVRGDTFYTIGKAHGVSWHAIAKANPGVDSRHLKLGQKLNLPAPSETTAASAGTNAAAPGENAMYTVKPGDTLGRIARRHHTTVRAIKAANELRTDRILAGQKLKLPAPKTAPGTAPNPTTSSVPAVTAPADTNGAPVGGGQI